MTAPLANLLLLADGRFPSGAHAHSAGLEQAIESGSVNDEAQLRGFLVGVLATTATNTAYFAVAAHHVWNARFDADPVDALAELDLEESARIPSPALRDASRAQGRQFLRAVAGSWPDAELPHAGVFSRGPYLSAAQGVASSALGIDSRGAALLSVYGAITGPATAAVRLLGLDPFAVNRVLTSLWEFAELVVANAAGETAADSATLPRLTAPLLETGAEAHVARELRMFAS